MRNIPRLTGARLLLVALACTVAFGVWVAATPSAEAVVIGGPSVCVYYSNGSYSNPVGARGTGCCGEPISWGVTTRFVRCERLYCLDVQCPF